MVKHKNLLQGKFTPKHPEKYHGDVSNIVFRSSWELIVMKYLDENMNVLTWNSEELAIPYFDPTQKKWRRYFPDFLATMRKPDGTTETVMIEVKPHKECVEPKVSSRKTKRYILEVTTYATNQSKWNAAREYCADRKWRFQVITEKELGLSR